MKEKIRLCVSLAIGLGAAMFIVWHSPIAMFYPSLGASACIMYTAPDSKPAAWYRVLIAHPMCAAIGIAASALLGDGWIECAAAVVAAIMIMSVLDLVHPPAAGTCLVGFAADVGISFAFVPVLSGMCALVAVSKAVLFIIDKICMRYGTGGGDAG